MEIKAYDLFLKPHQTFQIYRRDGIATLTTDETYPRPIQTTQRWNKLKQDFDPVSQPVWIDTTVFPTWEVLKEDLEDHLSFQIPLVLDALLSVGIEGNIFILRKDYGDFWEFSLAACQGRGTLINEYATKLIDQYMRMKAFW